MTQSQSQLPGPYKITPENDLAAALVVCETGAKKKKSQPRKYNFTAQEAALMRRQYEQKVHAKVIAEQWGIDYRSMHGVLCRVFKEHDPSFETHQQRKAKALRWCPWCGNNMPPFIDRKYCDDPECIEERRAIKSANALANTTCACGGIKGWGKAKCQACENKIRQASKAKALTCACGRAKDRKASKCSACVEKFRKSKKSNMLLKLRYMAIEGYSNRQIAAKLGTSLSFVWRGRVKVGVRAPRTSWRPEQEAYWLAQYIKVGSTKGLWQKAGLTRSAFASRVRRIMAASRLEKRAA